MARRFSLPVDEEAPTHPKGIYEISNLTAEKIIQVYNDVHGISAVLLSLDECLWTAGANETPALRCRQLVRTSRA